MRVRIPFLDRIWRVKSSLKLEESLSVPEAFERLDTLLSAQGTDYTVDGNTLTYVKTNPAAQDKLATFTGGTLTVVPEEGATRLHYDVTSTALFLCFLAPLVFLAFGQFAYLVNEIEKPGIAAELEEEKKEEEQQAKDEQAIELHWIDKLLGAPTPKQPGEEDQEERARDGRDGDRDEDEVEGNHSPETAYVIAGIFALIYLVGRFLEPYLLKRTFRWALTRPDEVEDLEDNKEMEADAKFAPQGGGPSQT